MKADLTGLQKARANEKKFQEAVEKAIADNHKRGMPAYQCEDGYIIAIYPGGKKVRLEKSSTLTDFISSYTF